MRYARRVTHTTRLVLVGAGALAVVVAAKKRRRRQRNLASGSKPIEGVGTSVAAFVGLAPGSPVNTPMR
jgi:hypothetical protein